MSDDPKPPSYVSTGPDVIDPVECDGCGRKRAVPGGGYCSYCVRVYNEERREHHHRLNDRTPNNW